jgi:hypothetical protein
MLQGLEERGYIRRDPLPDGGPNRYVLDGLFEALEQLMDQKASKAA